MNCTEIQNLDDVMSDPSGMYTTNVLLYKYDKCVVICEECIDEFTALNNNIVLTIKPTWNGKIIINSPCLILLFTGRRMAAPKLPSTA